jgi:DNA invertase Pin-like site-specific DNA recombinase
MPPTKETIAALYARLSTPDQKQDVQVKKLRLFAARMGWALVEYSENASSGKKHPVLNQMMAGARLRRFNVILVWKMDSFARSLLDSFGVRFIAISEGIDTDKRNPASRIMLHTLDAHLCDLLRVLAAPACRHCSNDTSARRSNS